MAEKTRIEQESIEVTLDDGSKTYQITTEVLEPGILPDIGLFVHRIVDPLDPKDDTFERVAQPQDINFMKRDRDDAIVAGDDEFLYFKVVLQYSDLEVAIQAKAAIKSRIDSSISTWYQYEVEFAGTAETLHPSVDPEYEQALKDAYKAARDVRIAADDAVTQAEEDLDDAQTALEHSQEIANIRQAEVEFCQKANATHWPVVQGQMTSLKTAGGNLYTQSAAFEIFASLMSSGAASFQSASATLLADMIFDYDAFPVSGVGTYTPDASPQTAYSAGTPTNTDWTDIWNNLNTYDGQPAAFLTLTGQYDGAYATWEPTIAAYLAALTSYDATGEPAITQLNDELSTFCSTATSTYNAALIDVSQKETNVTTAVNAKNEAEAEVASAQEAEDAALAAVRDVCPTFETTDV